MKALHLCLYAMRFFIGLFVKESTKAWEAMEKIRHIKHLNIAGIDEGTLELALGYSKMYGLLSNDALRDLGYLPSFNHFFTILTSTYLLSTDLDCEHGNRASVYAIYRKTDLFASFFAAYDIE